MSLEVEPKIVKIVSQRVFCVTEKTLNTNVFFSLLLFLGRPGRRQSSIFLTKTIIFAMRPFRQNNTVFHKTTSNWSTWLLLKPQEIANKCFYNLQQLCFFATVFFHGFVGKVLSFLEVPCLTFGTLFKHFCLLWLPRPHVCTKHVCL